MYDKTQDVLGNHNYKLYLKKIVLVNVIHVFLATSIGFTIHVNILIFGTSILYAWTLSIVLHLNHTTYTFIIFSTKVSVSVALGTRD